MTRAQAIQTMQTISGNEVSELGTVLQTSLDNNIVLETILTPLEENVSFVIVRNTDNVKKGSKIVPYSGKFENVVDKYFILYFNNLNNVQEYLAKYSLTR
jgi:hypothetical protein